MVWQFLLWTQPTCSPLQNIPQVLLTNLRNQHMHLQVKWTHAPLWKRWTTEIFSPLVSSVYQMFTICRKGRVSHWFSDVCFSWTENELTWDTSDWGSEWDSADNKQEDASSASMVCAMSTHFSCSVVISALVSALVTYNYRTWNKGEWKLNNWQWFVSAEISVITVNRNEITHYRPQGGKWI